MQQVRQSQYGSTFSMLSEEQLTLMRHLLRHQLLFDFLHMLLHLTLSQQTRPLSQCAVAASCKELGQ